MPVVLLLSCRKLKIKVLGLSRAAGVKADATPERLTGLACSALGAEALAVFLLKKPTMTPKII